MELKPQVRILAQVQNLETGEKIQDTLEKSWKGRYDDVYGMYGHVGYWFAITPQYGRVLERVSVLRTHYEVHWKL